jgi:hypothetical protein
VPDGVDLHSALVLVDAVDDPIGPAPRGVVAVERFIKWLADTVRTCSERPVDRLHGSVSDVEGQVLVQVAPGLPGEDDRVRSFGLRSGRLRIAGHDVRRRCPNRGPARGSVRGRDTFERCTASWLAEGLKARAGKFLRVRAALITLLVAAGCKASGPSRARARVNCRHVVPSRAIACRTTVSAASPLMPSSLALATKLSLLRHLLLCLPV